MPWEGNAKPGSCSMTSLQSRCHMPAAVTSSHMIRYLIASGLYLPKSISTTLPIISKYVSSTTSVMQPLDT